jgi:nitronate monooxygenase
VPLPAMFEGRLALPAIAAPMFLVSNPDLVVETCRAGLIGTFPALNQRSTERYESWLQEIADRLARAERDDPRRPAPFGVNIIVNKSNPRVEADLAVTVKHRVPLVITSLGAVKELVTQVHAYGGVVFHDVINIRHARKAAEAGVDGIIAVCAGAGGHAGTLSPFALLPEIRRFFPKTLVLSGALSTGVHIAAARMIGADLAYLGTRFIASVENSAPAEFKEMIVASQASDIVYTAAISGVHGNFLRPSIEASGAQIDLAAAAKPYEPGHRRKAWNNIWSAGQGVGSIDDAPSIATLCARLTREYHDALAEAAADRAALHLAPSTDGR